MTFEETFDAIFDPNKPKRVRSIKPLRHRLQLPHITAAPHQEVVLRWDDERNAQQWQGVSTLRIITVNQLLPDANDPAARDSYILSTATVTQPQTMQLRCEGRDLMKIVFEKYHHFVDTMPNEDALREISFTVHDALTYLARHEVDEWMRVDGQRFREPHQKR